MLCPGTILEVPADKDLWITYGFPRLPSGTISIFDSQAVPKYQALFKPTPSNFGGTEATFNENYCLKVRFWKDKTDVPARLYCGNSRTCLERPRADNGDVVTEINPYSPFGLGRADDGLGWLAPASQAVPSSFPRGVLFCAAVRCQIWYVC